MNQWKAQPTDIKMGFLWRSLSPKVAQAFLMEERFLSEGYTSRLFDFTKPVTSFNWLDSSDTSFASQQLRNFKQYLHDDDTSNLEQPSIN